MLRAHEAQGRDALLSPHSFCSFAGMLSVKSLGKSVVNVAYTCGRARGAALYHTLALSPQRRFSSQRHRACFQ
jgi:hypothetical protein